MITQSLSSACSKQLEYVSTTFNLRCFPIPIHNSAIGRTTDYMVTGLMSGLAVSTPSTFGVLLLATGSPLISLYAMLTIVLVVASLFETAFKPRSRVYVDLAANHPVIDSNSPASFGQWARPRGIAR